MENEGVSKLWAWEIFREADTGCKLIPIYFKHVLDIYLSLISIGKVYDDDYCIQFSESKWKFTKGSLVISIGKEKGILYYLHEKLSKGEMNTIKKDPGIELWYIMLKHINEKWL